MGLACGIVGLPNVGKSTLFNALSSARADAQNYPFCTIEPNVAVVAVPDDRLDSLAGVFKPPRVIGATLDLVDIAGLVRGAAKGEGLGNQFLSHIRECDAVLHVVRCFEASDVVHVDGRIDPVSDVETIQTELCLKDLDTVDKRGARSRDMIKANKPEDRLAVEVCSRLSAHLGQLKPARTLVTSGDPLFESQDAQTLVREMCLLTAKPMLLVGNVDEASAANPLANPLLRALADYAKREGTPLVPICASIEAQIAELDPADRPEFQKSVGIDQSGLTRVIRAGYDLLGLITYFTAGEPEVRAWTISRGTRAPQAAGKIHTDFERGFIKAEIVHWEDWLEHKSLVRCREAGKLYTEGKEYLMRDGDIVHFRFNV